jgi:hypothetical protein
LINRHFICYPYSLLKKNPLNSYPGNYTDWFIKLFKKHFHIDFVFGDHLDKYEKTLRKLDCTFKKFLYDLRKRHNCMCLIQDCDYLAERVIFTERCASENIPTISLDHSVNLNTHLFTESRSDYALVWGRHQQDRIIKFSSRQPRKILITGKCGCPFPVKSGNTRREKNWVYFLPAYQEPHLQSFYRSLEDSLKRINELQNLASQSGIRLYVKPHPSDEKRIFPKDLILTNKSLDTLAALSCLFFVEDSTIAIEAIKYVNPVIYFADRLNHEPLNNRNFCNDYNYCLHDQSVSEVLQKLKKPEHVNSKNIYKYFISNFRGEETINLNQLISPLDDNVF